MGTVCFRIRSTATREATAIIIDPSISLEAAPAADPPAAAARHDRTHRIDLVAIDLDGTLLRSDKKLSKKVAESVREAAARGVHIVLATARPPRAVRSIYRHLGLQSPQINYNGALIHDEHRGRTIFHQPLPVKLGEQVVSYARKIDPNVVISIEILDKWYTDHVDHSLPTETSKSFSPDFVGPLEAFTHKPATKIMFLAPPDRMGRIHSAITAKFGKKVTIIVCDAHLIQVIHPKADKQVALERVAADYGIKRENVMAIGDAPNDERMIRWAGIGIAMENAWPQVREIARDIVPTNDAHGVAVALRKYVL